MILKKYGVIKVPEMRKTASCQFCKNKGTHVVIVHFDTGHLPGQIVCGKHLKQLVKELKSVLKKQGR